LTDHGPPDHGGWYPLLRGRLLRGSRVGVNHTGLLRNENDGSGDQQTEWALYFVRLRPSRAPGRSRVRCRRRAVEQRRRSIDLGYDSCTSGTSVSLEREGLVHLSTYHGVAHRWTLLPRLRTEKAGLVTNWNEGGA